MLLLIIFSFLAGVVTVLSPCILPVLPVVLSGTLGGRKKPLGIVFGFVLSFTFFTLALSTLVKQFGLSADLLRNLSVLIILFFGISLLLPQVQLLLEGLFTRFASRAPKMNSNTGFWPGLLIGLSLGLVWTPCVGPIIASVITLAATSSVNSETVIVTFAYSIGTAIPMLAIMVFGRNLFTKIPWLLPNTLKIQKGFGMLMILVALGIFFNFDRKFQSYVLEKFPSYGTGLTKIEDTDLVKNQLQNLQKADLGGSNSPAPDLIPGGLWFNSPPLTLAGLRGKVVLVDFWTYTCINCIRTLPYIESWYEKYKDKGLVIIGVHTPEFEFEKNPDNLAKAIKDFKLTYPIMQDNNYATWNAYSNRYWPAKYFIDKDGKIRSTHFGEGNYDESEKIIQDLLKEIGVDVKNMTVANPTYNIESRTPETYLGYQKLAGFASNEEIKPDVKFSYSAPEKLPDNSLAYSGEWIVTSGQAMPGNDCFLTFNFSSKNVFLVMRPKGKNPGIVKVLLDGKVVSQEAGDDVKNGMVKVDQDRLYSLIKLSSPGRHILKLEFQDSNLELYAFTFG